MIKWQGSCVTLSGIAQYSSLLPRNSRSDPCFSVSVAVHTFIPATDHSLGSPLHYQLANQNKAPLKALLHHFTLSIYAVFYTTL